MDATRLSMTLVEIIFNNLSNCGSIRSGLKLKLLLCPFSNFLKLNTRVYLAIIAYQSLLPFRESRLIRVAHGPNKLPTGGVQFARANYIICTKKHIVFGNFWRKSPNLGKMRKIEQNM